MGNVRVFTLCNPGTLLSQPHTVFLPVRPPRTPLPEMHCARPQAILNIGVQPCCKPNWQLYKRAVGRYVGGGT